uniref:Uncharacterized protein n=1 Tax=Panagrolaimus sp. JU765 TaxID=591449 RepID=A0AC34QQT9_9BILA
MLSRLIILRQTRSLTSNFTQKEYFNYSSQKKFDEKWKKKKQNGSQNDSKFRFGKTAPLFGLSFLATVKDVLGIDPVKLDDDPLKDKIKQSWLNRKRGKYDEAIEILHNAIPEAQDRKDPLILTRIIDELANTYYEKGDLENAEKCFRDVVQRLVAMHGKNDSSPEFIGVSLKMADIFARKGDLDSAETGFKHCVTRQLQVMESHLKNFLISKGAGMEEQHLVEAHGAKYSDPVALFGMCLELFAHFLVEFRGEDRLREAEEYMDEVLKISTHLFGSNSFHSMNILNNFGAICVIKNRFEMAKKYLSIGIERVLHINECSGLVVGYYCNYAEALFHTGEVEKALQYARKAVILAKDEDPKLQKYAANFLKQIERDARNLGKTSGGGWFSWLF